jgi:dephospho-CoA kinase
MLSALRDRWGEGIESGGVVDRGAVGQIVFNDPDELSWLEREVHPLVQREIADWFAGLTDGCEVAVVEVPLLFEGEMVDRFDLTVAIVADEEVRRERARARGHAGIEGREDRQLPQDEKAVRADHVVVNDGTTEDLRNRLAEMLRSAGVDVPTGRRL